MAIHLPVSTKIQSQKFRKILFKLTKSLEIPLVSQKKSLCMWLDAKLTFYNPPELIILQCSIILFDIKISDRLNIKERKLLFV